jgi:membrane-associated phospholipid phosphatase
MKSIFVSILLLIIGFSVNAQNIDIDLLKDINLNRNRKLDNTFILISQSITPVSIGVPVSVYCIGLIKHDSAIKNKGLYIGASLLVSGAITVGLKYSVHRPRPFVTYPFIEKSAKAGSLSFPSGHTSSAFATATSLSLTFPKWYVIAPSYVWACSVAYSRMNLGVHYPSDVLAGAIIGAGSSYLCYKANKWLNQRKLSN